MAYGNRLQRLVYEYSPAPVRDLVVTAFSRGRGRVKFGPKFHECLADLDRTQWYGPQEYRALAEEKLRRIVNYAVAFVPYYQQLFAELSISPLSIRTIADLPRLPILDRATLQARQADLHSSLYSDQRLLERFQTSGTTGRPVDIVVTRDCLQLEKAFASLHRRWGGVEPGARSAVFVGFPVVPLRQRKPPFWVRDRAENRVMYSLQHMSAANLPAYADSLAAYKPDHVYGYPTAIYLVAVHLNQAGITSVRPRSVMTGSETLLAHQRAEIERAFGCRVFDWYGATEFIANIVQCELGNYHIKNEYGVVEILLPDGSSCPPGEAGEMICTGLNNLAMPLIRYRIGDMAVPKAGPCPCGRAGELVEQITGRVEDIIVTPDGRWLSRLDFVFKGMEKVDEAQLVQEAADRLRVRVVRRPGFSDSDQRRILANLRERLGQDIQIEFEYPSSIARSASGKFRYVVSNVPLGLRGIRQTGEILAGGTSTSTSRSGQARS